MDPVQETLEAAMPWVGRYIAAASAVCTLAMAADVVNGFRTKKLWFPCKYFSLNAASLTLLAVAMKLPMDLTSVMIKSPTDWVTKHTSLLFMVTAMGNFMSSLGSMTGKEILANVVALSILVVTIVADVLIQLVLLQPIFQGFNLFFMFPAILMFLLLATLVSLAITVSTTKESLETMHHEKHKVALSEQEMREAFRIDGLRGYMMKYWVMAETSSPQFVMARSVVCTTAAIICLLAAIILVLDYPLLREGQFKGASPYGESTKWILYVQSTGVAIGTIAPTFRWFIAVSFKYSVTKLCSFDKAFKIEAHWIQALVDWRDSFPALRIRQDKYRRCLHGAKWFAITFCIRLQIFTILLSKLFVFLSALLISPFFLCFTHIKKFVMQYLISNNQTGHQPGDDTYVNLSHYVLLLEGEAELPRTILKNICREADKIIEKGRKKQPRNLVNLLQKSVNFNGVGKFDTNQIPSLHSEEPLNCWTLPLVTLTSIAAALPNTGKHKGNRLLSCVSEGLSLVKLVEETLDKNALLVNIRNAADICWVGVVLYMQWLEIDLRRTSLKCKSSVEVLQELSDKAEAIIVEFKKEENPLNWPTKVVAANSMYRTSRTLLLYCDDQTDDGLFERISVMIADILAACLTNIPHVITTMCHHSAIETKEKSVRKAFCLLGETKGVLERLQQHEWPSLDHDKAASIEEWRRAFFQQNKRDPVTSASTSSDETGTII